MELARKVLPYWIYRRIFLTHYREYFTFKIDYGFGYWLRAVRYKYPDNMSGATAPRLNLEFFDNANFKARQPLPFCPEMISTPGINATALQTNPQPVDSTGTYTMDAKPAPFNTTPLNWLYKYGDTIRIDITGQNISTPGSESPMFIDLLLQGYYVPQEAFELYGGKE